MPWNQKLKPVLLLASALLLGVLSASVAQAQSPWRCSVADHADQVVHLSRNVRSEILHVAKHSQVFGQMLSETGIMEGNAAVLKAWARHRDPCYLQEQAEKVHRRVHRLASLVQVARLRCQNGLDRPMAPTYELERLLGLIEAEITHALGDIPAVHAPVPGPVYPSPVYPSQGYRYRDTGPVIVNRPNFAIGGSGIRFSTRNGLHFQLDLNGRRGGRGLSPQFRNQGHSHGHLNQGRLPAPNHHLGHGVPTHPGKGKVKKNAGPPLHGPGKPNRGKGGRRNH